MGDEWVCYGLERRVGKWESERKTMKDMEMFMSKKSFLNCETVTENDFAKHKGEAHIMRSVSTSR